MARRSRHRRHDRSSRTAPTLPADEVPIDTGTARIEPDPDHSSRVTLHVNGVPSSCLDLDDPGFLAFEYLQQMAAVVDLLPAGPVRAVHLGAAGCALPRQIDHVRPGSRQIGVDVDARLLALVREWFDLPRSPALRLRAQDGGQALDGLTPGLADVVVRDAFDGDRTPAHLVGERFADACRRALRPGGVALANCADRPPLTTTRAEVAAFAEAFGPDAAAEHRLAVVAEPAVLKGRRYGNVVVAAVAPSPRRGATGGRESGAARPEEADDADGAVDSAADSDDRHPDTLPDLGSATLGRALRSLAVPAQVLTGPALERFVGTTTSPR
ncbi:fused MFS/spermidine synthase [Isoptericola chiayiensis]|uniref:Fused MFS/spermidine synthase n=1 Tax=Isoptericola chiayiensis TaxID=579446 RepID=A0ABP8YNR6_9MICO|nr:fused MFS/spermidine synthase [Isoptericola chiayiensis]NOW01549.1 spermidine synthase [Isoptericola chiayiensis]